MDEPELQVAAEATDAERRALHRVSDDAHDAGIAAESDEDADAGAAHPVRDRLLARAAEARRARGLAPDQEDSDSVTGIEEELDRVAVRRPPAAPRAGRRAALSPNIVALFGSLFGLAMVAALFAILIRLDPRTPGDRAVASTTTAAAEQKTSVPTPPVPKRVRKKVPGPWRIADAHDPGLRKIEGHIGRDPFLKAIEAAGLQESQAYRVLKALKDLKNLDKCDRNDEFFALIDRASSKIKAFEYLVSKEEVYQAKEGDDGLLKGARLDLKVERERVQGAMIFDRDTFAASAEAAGFEPGLSKTIDEALQGHLTVAEFKKGDRLRVVAQEVTVLGEFEHYAGLEALEYVPADSNAKSIRIYYFKGITTSGYFDAQGRSPFEGGWRKPIKGAPITSHFNLKRFHPILKRIMPHLGTDFGAPMGTPVGATAPGVVKFAGYEGPGGNHVAIEHPGGYVSIYMHLSRFEEGLKVGDHVGRLQIIGYVGSTGRSTGPHLHFSVKKDDKFIDPESLNLDSLHVLPKDDRDRFSATRADYDKLIDVIPLPKAIEQPVAAAKSAEAESADEAEEDGTEGEASSATAVSSNAPAPPPAAAAPAPAAPSPQPAQNPVKSGSSIYLSDRELIEKQSATDDGEVEQ